MQNGKILTEKDIAQVKVEPQHRVLLWVNLVLTALIMLLIVGGAGQTTSEGQASPQMRSIGLDAADITAIAREVNQVLIDERAAEESEAAAESARTLRSLADLQVRSATIRGLTDSAEIAGNIRELEAWEFAPEDIEQVGEITDGLLDFLSVAVVRQVSALHSAALGEARIVDGKRKLAAAAEYLELHPEPRTREAKEALQRLSESQGSVAIRLDSLQRLAYNRWAVKNINLGLQYVSKSKSWNPISKNEHLVQPLISYLAKIDPVYLEPAPSLLYSKLLTVAEDRLGTDQYQQLAAALVAAGNNRETPVTF